MIYVMEKNNSNMNNTLYIVFALFFIFQLSGLKSQTKTDSLEDVASRIESTQILDVSAEMNQLDTTYTSSTYSMKRFAHCKRTGQPYIQ